jgi:hypothetical protein
MTLIEVMVASGIFSFVVIGVVYLHMYGMLQDQLVESKLGASDQARKDFGLITRDIRGTQIFEIGNYSGGIFTSNSVNTPQVGNAVRLGLSATVYPGTNILYYFDTNNPSNVTLKRIHTGDAAPTIIASSLTNCFGGLLTFDSEDYQGNIVSDLLDRRVVHFSLGFAQYQYPLTVIGSGFLYDFYKMEFRVTPHVPPGR